jgi:Ca2+-binding RTX toxin-like protein
MNTNIRSIAARLVLIGGIAGAGMTIVPGVVSADLAACSHGTVFEAKGNNTTIYGTGCNDIIKVGQFSGVTVYAGGGNDTVRAGFAGTPHIYLQGGNDTVVNPNDNEIWVDGGAGNDTVEGSSGYDAYYGGSGTDTFLEANEGDFYDSVELWG